MNDFFYKLYYKLPPRAKNIVASIEGARLKSWRYGNYYKSLLPGIRERETWSRDRIESFQENAFLKILRSAVNHVPYYRDLFLKMGLDLSDFNAISDIEKLPILEKETIRKNPAQFIDQRIKRGSLQKIHTSGTTGTPITVWFSHQDMQRRYAYHEMRIRRWWGVSLMDRYAMIGGKLVVRFQQEKPPFWIWNSALNQLYMSSYHLSPQLIGFYLEELRKRRLSYIFGYASSLFSLAYFAKEKGIDDIRYKVAFSNAEPFYAHQRKLIEDVFHCDTADHYGNSEYVCLATECRHGKLHMSPEVGIIEIVNAEGKPAAEGEAGDLICTGLINETMPLIRYRIGDRGTLDPSACSCKIEFPILKEISGRNDDVLITADGRRIGRLDPIFKADFGIREAQIIQESINRVRVKYIPGENFKHNDLDQIASALRERMGDVEIEMTAVSAIERTKSGKFRAVINKINSPTA